MVKYSLRKYVIESCNSSMDKRQSMQQALSGLNIRLNVPAKNYTSFRIGGPMALFAEPESVDELAALLAAAKRYEYPFYVIGNGSNLLVSDRGVDALFIRIAGKMAEYSIDGCTLVSDAGALLCTVSKASVASGLAGLEWAAGIPGTVGGGVAMNAGAYGGELRQVLRSVTLIENGEIITKPVLDGDMGYRRSAFAFPDSVVVRAEMRLFRDDGSARERMEEYALLRKQKQPVEMPSAGSTFKRPEGKFAGALIEQAGLKGKRIGNAMVSPKHAGFIVNCGGASFDDVTALIDCVQRVVERKFGVLLEPEVKIIK